jgi:uncharacterized protein involved in exopolysaccharide biosynthesis
MNIGSITEALWRRRLIVVGVLSLGLVAFVAAVSSSRSYTATATVLAASTASSSDGGVLDPGKDPIAAAVTPQDLPALLRSATVIGRITADLKLSGRDAEKLPSEIKARTTMNSDLIPIQVTDRNPNRAILAANAATRELARYEREIITSRYSALINDLRNQVADARARLHDVDDRMTALSTGDPYVSAENGTSAINARLVALEQQRDQLRAAMQGDAASAKLVSQRPALARDLANTEIVQNDPIFQSLRTQYGKDLAQLNAQKAGYTESFPGLAGLQDQVTRENASLQAAIGKATAVPGKSNAYVSAELDSNKAQATYAADQAQLATVESEIAAMQQHLTASGSANVSISALRRDRDAITQAYQQLQLRLAKAIADRSQAASIGSIVVIDPASSVTLPLLARPTVLAIGLGVAFLWLAITLALLVDSTDPRLRTARAIEELYGTPVFTPVG